MNRYSYLWHGEHLVGRDEGVKDRPCAIVLMVRDTDERDIVTVLPVTHHPPREPADAVEIPLGTKNRLGLDTERSWVVVTEANRFVWPGPDLRPSVRGNFNSVAYGSLPETFFETVRLALLKNIKSRRLPLVSRTE